MDRPKSLNKILLNILVSVTLIFSLLIYYLCIYVKDTKMLIKDYYKPNCQEVYEDNISRLSYLFNITKTVRNKLKVLPQAYEISSVVHANILAETYDVSRGTAIVVVRFEMDNNKFIEVVDTWKFNSKQLTNFNRSVLDSKLSLY